ncbi:unnamed protein product [Mytilus coruscus]|uniref:Uncharacterized protein n=1 Tax=Mytilus coruscus TaxID=42192 RepID=A0A6J8CC30_MYTCO|nr:unnamed protein product [Mytilus coruscus]
MFTDLDLANMKVTNRKVIILTCTNGYDWKCPHSSQWNLTSRSYGCSDQNIYICLFDASESIGLKVVFTGKCGPLDLSREGFRYILTPDLNQVPCTASRYQPFTFTTNGNSQCVLSKSVCNASGQILANNGSSSTDISCRCDYRRNYDYIIPPKNPCSCKPAEEDCSCYIRKCEDDKVMIAGKYLCDVCTHAILALLINFKMLLALSLVYTFG